MHRRVARSRRGPAGVQPRSTDGETVQSLGSAKGSTVLVSVVGARQSRAAARGTLGEVVEKVKIRYC